MTSDTTTDAPRPPADRPADDEMDPGELLRIMDEHQEPDFDPKVTHMAYPVAPSSQPVGELRRLLESRLESFTDDEWQEFEEAVVSTRFRRSDGGEWDLGDLLDTVALVGSAPAPRTAEWLTMSAKESGAFAERAGSNLDVVDTVALDHEWAAEAIIAWRDEARAQRARNAELEAEVARLVKLVALSDRAAENSREYSARMDLEVSGLRARVSELTATVERMERELPEWKDRAGVLEGPVPDDDPVRPLGEWLCRLLDEDQWPAAERHLNSLREFTTGQASKGSSLTALAREMAAMRIDPTDPEKAIGQQRDFASRLAALTGDADATSKGDADAAT